MFKFFFFFLVGKMLNIITRLLILTEITEIHEVIEIQKCKLNRRTQPANNDQQEIGRD